MSVGFDVREKATCEKQIVNWPANTVSVCLLAPKAFSLTKKAPLL